MGTKTPRSIDFSNSGVCIPDFRVHRHNALKALEMIIPCEPRERRFEAVTEVCVMTINSKDRSTLGQFEAHFPRAGQ